MISQPLPLIRLIYLILFYNVIIVKHKSLYQERRFTKLGYSAASILDALLYLRVLLNESHLTNQYIEIVRMFVDSEFFITELSVLAFFIRTTEGFPKIVLGLTKRQNRFFRTVFSEISPYCSQSTNK